jgi:putative membrane protein
MMGGFGFGMLGMGALLLIGFWALVIGGGVWLAMALTRGRSTGTSGSSHPAGLAPLDILKVRYAQGEITKEQFDQMKSDLGA